MTVFLVDDSAAIVERLQEMLLPLPGIQMVGCAFDVPEALLAIREARPQAVILDICLPSGSGLEVLRNIKDEMPETIVIILSNNGAPQYQRRCREDGADAVLDKSREFANVAEVLQQLGTRAGYLAEPHSLATSRSR